MVPTLEALMTKASLCFLGAGAPAVVDSIVSLPSQAAVAPAAFVARKLQRPAAEGKAKRRRAFACRVVFLKAFGPDLGGTLWNRLFSACNAEKSRIGRSSTNSNERLQHGGDAFRLP